MMDKRINTSQVRQCNLMILKTTLQHQYHPHPLPFLLIVTVHQCNHRWFHRHWQLEGNIVHRSTHRQVQDQINLNLFCHFHHELQIQKVKVRKGIRYQIAYHPFQCMIVLLHFSINHRNTVFLLLFLKLLTLDSKLIQSEHFQCLGQIRMSYSQL